MTYRAKHPAAFINALSEGPKAEAIEWLQRTWDDLQDLRAQSPKPPNDAAVMWARDIDGSGSWHPCAMDDPGAVEFHASFPSNSEGNFS